MSSSHVATETDAAAPSTFAPAGGARRALGVLRWTKGEARWLLAVGSGILLVYVVFAIFAPEISRYDFSEYRTPAGVRFPTLAHPSSAHWLGTNSQTTDVFSHIVYGSRTALEVVALAVVFSLIIGVPAGVISGYFGGPLDRVLVLVMDALYAFPYLLLAIVIAFVLERSIGGGVMTAALAITVVYVPQYFRVLRNQVISVREEQYVEAARSLGARPRTILVRYIFFNVVQSVPVIATLNAASAILALAGLGFLGYGVEPTQAAEWGYDLQRAVSDASAGIWWTSLFPGLAIVLLVTALTLVGEGLNETFNPLVRDRRLAPPHIPVEEEPANDV